MCGIGVALDWDGAEAVVRKLIEGLIHRGDITDPLAAPRPNTAMCTRRLRIVDGEHGAQPMLSADGRIAVSFNGEIYNHMALRASLEAEGVVFKTLSDTEVLANALSRWGQSALWRINGMFAFVAINIDSGAFLAARDLLGEKPLYAMQSGAGLLFCSEMRPLLSATDAGVVFPIPPGHGLTRTGFATFASAFVDPAIACASHDPVTLDRLLAAAVHIRVPPDLPCATMFSGGIDSTLVTHYARQIRPDIPGYFLGEPDAPDFRYAASYADRSGLDLRCVPFDIDDDAEDQISETVAMVEAFEPDVIRSSFCTATLSRRIRKDGYRVVLCGEGADELFAGYIPLELAYAHSQQYGAMARDQQLAIMHMSNLQRVDRCTMRSQIEARQPFLDPAIITYATHLRASDLVRDVDGESWGKWPLRSLYDLYPDQLPSVIRDRRKLPLGEGSGFDQGPSQSPWRALAEQSISDLEYRDGQKRYPQFDLRTKEELFYLTKLAEVLDLARVPHLSARSRMRFPKVDGMERLRPYTLQSDL